MRYEVTRIWQNGDWVAFYCCYQDSIPVDVGNETYSSMITSVYRVEINEDGYATNYWEYVLNKSLDAETVIGFIEEGEKATAYALQELDEKISDASVAIEDKATVDYVDEEIGKVREDIIENEVLIAESLYDLNDRLEEMSKEIHSNATQTAVENELRSINETIVNNEKTTANALTDLYNRLQELSDRLEEINNLIKG